MQKFGYAAVGLLWAWFTALRFGLLFDAEWAHDQAGIIRALSYGDGGLAWHRLVCLFT